MNKPTKQLIDRAGLTLKPRQMYPGSTTYLVSDDDHFDDNLEAVRAFFDQGAEKLVHMVVQECAQFVEDTYDLIGDEILIKEEMLEHFGVEK